MKQNQILYLGNYDFKPQKVKHCLRIEFVYFPFFLLLSFTNLRLASFPA